MRALAVLAHPEKKSFNSQMKDVAVETLSKAGYTVDVSDLYAMGFDPVEGPRHYPKRVDESWFDTQAEQRAAWDSKALPPAVQAEIDKVAAADFIFIQYPMWWFGSPAILKGWIDRVFVYGLYTSTKRYNHGPWKGKKAMLSVTTGAPETTHGPDGRNADADLLLWPMHYTLYYIGLDVLPPFVACGVEGGLKYSSPEAITARLNGHKERLATTLRGLDGIQPLRFNAIEEFDQSGRLKPESPSHSHFIRHRG